MAETNPFDHFDEHCITHVLDELETRFGFPKKNWRMQFNEYYLKQKRNEAITGAFIYYGNTMINPILNAILCRKESHNTFTDLCIYVNAQASLNQIAFKKLL